MGNVKFKLNRAGVKELMQSEEMMQICKEYADNAVNKLGNGYTVSTYNGKSRVNVSIAADSFKARREVYENNSILKALGG